MDSPDLFEQRVIISGVGLIGGSIAAAIRKRFPSTEVIGIGRNKNRLSAAQAQGLLTSYTTEPTEDLVRDSLVVVCLPVQLIATEIRRLAAIGDSTTAITDAGSVKNSICEEIAVDSSVTERFLAAHPIAGGEQGGFENSDPDLFEGRNCVLTPDEIRPTKYRERITRFWQSIGCRICVMSPAEHDAILAMTSHLPHIMAAVTTNVVGPQNLYLTGAGFRDTTRVAAGGSELWTQILLENSTSIIQAIADAEAQLKHYRTALQAGDRDSIANLLSSASECRRLLNCESSVN